MTNYLTQRNGIYYFMRRVPEHVAHLESKQFIRSSLKTRDKKEAIRQSSIWNDYIEEYWQSLLVNNRVDSQTAYKLAVKQAKLHGFTYKSATDISNEPLSSVIDRVSIASKAIDKSEVVSSLLGGHDIPQISLDSLWQEYYAFKKPDLLGKSDRQMERWKNPRIRSYKTFLKVCGDIPVNDITREHILAFRTWWSERLQDAGMAPNSANKDFTHLRSLLAYGQDNKNSITIDVNSLFARIRFKERDSERQPFATDFILSHLLNHNNLHGLNDECRYFLFAMADTGARPSELLGLDVNRGDIRLDTDIPYIFIRPDKDREIKNQYSKRQIPLVGSSLYAFRHLQNGFKQYFQKPDQLSANLNGFLRDHSLLPTNNHTVYSLRHSFEDRLSAVEPPEKVQSFIMGHKYRRERYGEGPTLEQKKKWLDKMCFKEYTL